MRITWKQAWGALALTAVGIWAWPGDALSNGPQKGKFADAVPDQHGQESSILRIPRNGPFPFNKTINVGGGRSMMVQFPMELRDVMISDPDKVDIVLQSSDRVFLIAKKAGSANAFFFDANGNQVATINVNIGSDLSTLDGLFKKLIPTSTITSELAGATIVLTGTVRSPADSQRAADIAKQYASANKGQIGSRQITSTRSEIGGVTTWQMQASGGDTEFKPVINMLQIEGEEQVQLKVTVAEVNRTALKQFGVNMSASIGSGNFGLSGGTMNTFPITATTLGALPNSGVASTATPATSPPCNTILPQIGNTYLGQSGFTGGFSAGSSCLAYNLRALERHGLVRTLAEPSLTAVSGETARFVAGGEYPVPVNADNGTVAVTFKEFGVAVAFTPVVLSEGRISLKIDTNVSELSNEGAVNLSGIQIPSLRKRSALSTVELPSGGSIALAGLISESTCQNIEGLPGLKSLPILGALFRSRDFSTNETELVIIVTPYMVRPTSRQNLARPDDGLAASSDLKANFLGQINRVYGRTGTPIPDGGLKGNHGYIVD